MVLAVTSVGNSVDGGYAGSAEPADAPLAVFDVDDTIYTGIGDEIPLWLTAATHLAVASYAELLEEDEDELPTRYGFDWYQQSEEWQELRSRVEDAAQERYMQEVLEDAEIRKLGDDITDLTGEDLLAPQDPMLDVADEDADPRDVGVNYVPPETLEDLNTLYWLQRRGEVENPQEAVLETAYHFREMLDGNEKSWVVDTYEEMVDDGKIKIDEDARAVLENHALHNDLYIVSNNHQPLLETLVKDLAEVTADDVRGTAVEVDDEGRYTEGFERNMFTREGKYTAMREIARTSNTGAGSVAVGDHAREDAPLWAAVENRIVVDPTGTVDEDEVWENIQSWGEQFLGRRPDDADGNGLADRVRRLLGGDNGRRIVIVGSMRDIRDDFQRQGDIYQQLREAP